MDVVLPRPRLKRSATLRPRVGGNDPERRQQRLANRLAQPVGGIAMHRRDAAAPIQIDLPVGAVTSRIGAAALRRSNAGR